MFLKFAAGKNFEKVCEICRITLNKTAIFGDNGTISPTGVRIGKQESLNCTEISSLTPLLFLVILAGSLHFCLSTLIEHFNNFTLQFLLMYGEHFPSEHFLKLHPLKYNIPSKS